MPKATADPEPVLYVVVEPFIADENGVPVPYQRGQVIHPDDPYLKVAPDRFQRFVFPHPVKVRRALSLDAPELRADG